MFFSRTKFGTLQSAVTLSYALFSFLREIQTARTNMIFQRASNFVEQIRTLHLHIMQLKVYKERDRRCTYIVILEPISCDHCCSRTARSISYSECVFVDLVIPHAPYYTVICGLPYFSTLSHKRHGFRKKKSLLKMKCIVYISPTHALYIKTLHKHTKNSQLKSVIKTSFKLEPLSAMLAAL